MINKMTNRVPALIKQSHLERKKGGSLDSILRNKTDRNSMDDLLAPDLPSLA